MDTLSGDARLALRTLRQNPGFTIASIAILAIGIAANTAVFSVADAVLFRPLPYENPEQLMALSEMIPQYSHLYPRIPVNAAHYYAWRERTRTFADLAIMQDGALNLTSGDGPPERLKTELVSSNTLPLLGVKPFLGRDFTAADDEPKNNRVVLLSAAVWQRRFHGDTGVLGRTIVLDGNPHVIAGVLPADFHFPRPDLLAPIGGTGLRDVDVLKPLALDRSKLQDNFNYTVLGRLKPGATREQGLTDLNTIEADLTKQANTAGMEFRAVVNSLQDQLVSGSRRGLLLLLGAIGMVLLIMCVNLGNLMLARAAARQREMAVRSALGASQWRMIRQVLTESIGLSLTGGLAGVALAYVAVRAFIASAPVDIPRLNEVHLDMRALLFALAISFSSGLLFGVIPAWRAAHSSPQDVLRTGGRTITHGRQRLRLSEVLVGTEVALSAALLIVAGLLVGSFLRLLGIDQGFQPDHVLTASLNLPGTKYHGSKQRSDFFDRMLPALRRLPGVEAAGLSTALPLQGETWVGMITREDDHRPMFQRPTANFRFISPGYFSAMGIPVIRGRDCTEADHTRDVAIVSASTAARIWPGQQAIGKRIRSNDDDSPWAEVIGIVPDTRTVMDRTPPLMVYEPYWRQSETGIVLVVRTAQDPSSVAAAVRSAIWSIDSEMPVPEMKVMREIVHESVSQRRFQMWLLTAFAISALLLAAIGIYGVISYSVNGRRNEIGIRMALGAEVNRVRRMVLTQGMRPVAAGVAIGVAAALVFGRLLESLLFEMKSSNPVVLGSVVTVLVLAAAAACYAPALRATRVDPSIALRYE
ncbi:MAG TPA: ABC transporter permease [Bryobacteraceae bacterium]|nr:ABC transporter permease [Bryobacteraceae bacterium]